MNLANDAWIFANLWLCYLAFFLVLEEAAKLLPRGKVRTVLTTAPIMLTVKRFPVFAVVYSGLVALYTTFVTLITHGEESVKFI